MVHYNDMALKKVAPMALGIRPIGRCGREKGIFLIPCSDGRAGVIVVLRWRLRPASHRIFNEADAGIKKVSNLRNEKGHLVLLSSLVAQAAFDTSIKNRFG